MISKTKKKWNLWWGIFFLLLFPSLVGGYDGITVTNGGTISGFVKVQGSIPKLPPLEVSKSRETCRNVPNESLVVGPNRGLRYAVVTLEGIKHYGIYNEKRKEAQKLAVDWYEKHLK